MRIILIADTHGCHREVKLPAGDMLIHAGDISTKGDENEVLDFLDWFSSLDFAHKIFIAGNHDFYFEKRTIEEIESVLPKNIYYLQDSGITIDGFKIWGSPITPWYFNWAFNRRADAIVRHWDMIPRDTDILITHGPPFRILDTNIKDQHTGCKELLLAVQEIQPRLHVFGHIHESYGMVEKKYGQFINASIMDHEFKIRNKPAIVNL
ncbi:MAG TPA: metallophosphatase domain-containing protein [Chitinophagaceae bacterium]|jgi:Icc-related predicted phosphoesterase|nr:metallophosphatase domain-containing protein [Chitinophagaceae bacterium]